MRFDIKYLDIIYQGNGDDTRRVVRNIVGMSVLAGLAQGLVVAVINSGASVSGGDGNSGSLRMFLMFGVIMITYISSKHFALTRSARVVETAVSRLRCRLSDKIRHGNYSGFESIGHTEVHTLLTRECIRMSEQMPVLINGCASVVMLFVTGMYIAFLSQPAVVMTVVLTVIASFYYLHNYRGLMEFMKKANKVEDKFVSLISHLLKGFKEVKMNRSRSDDLYENHIVKKAGETAEVKISNSRLIARLMLFGQTFFYILIAAVAFLLPVVYTEVDPQTIVKLTAAVLFIMGPIGEVINIIPVHAQINVAAGNLINLEAKLEMDDLKAESEAAGESAIAREEKFGLLEVKDVVFSYQDHIGRSTFTLGPTNMTVKKGELVYVVGGNGSGKSTLMKVLSGLYHPVRGSISFNGIRLDPYNCEDYRQYFSIIFTDFHLFDRLYGLQDLEPQVIDEYLKMMHLEGITAVSKGAFTNLDLSTGQRKRLALMVALLEDRPVCIFDEVAADQDPSFRKFYYEELLPSMTKKGKTIIAVTHDDRYFHTADRVLKMDYGRFVEE